MRVNYLSKDILKHLADSNSVEYRKLLIKYLQSIQGLQKESKSLMESIEKESQLLSRQEWVQRDLQAKIQEKYKKLITQDKFKEAEQLIKKDALPAYSRYLSAKHSIQDEVNYDKILTLLKNSYMTIDQLRAAVTGQKTSYRLAFSTGRGKNKQYFEREVSLSELLDASYLEVTQKDLYKLRLQFSKEQKMAWTESRESQLRYGVTDITADYKKFLSFIQNKPGTFGNEGNKYEMYRKFRMLDQSYYSDDYRSELLERVRQEVMSNTTSFVKGVDHAYMQGYTARFESIKSLFGSNPTLGTLRTMERTFSEIEKILGTGWQAMSPDSIREQLQTVMPPEQIQMSIEQQVQQQVQQTIPDLVQQTFMQSGFGVYIMN